MGGRSAIAAGLVMGMAVGGIVLGGVVFLAPGPSVPASDPPATASPLPSPTVASPLATTPGPASPATPSATAAPPGSGSPDPSGASSVFGVGEPAPSLSVEQLGGGRIDLAALRGKPVWVNFTASWCPPCRDELPLMAGFAARYGDTGLVVLVIDVREDVSTIDAFTKVIGVTLPIGMDADGAAQQAWGAYALPVHFWVDRDGVVRDGALGGIGPDIMAAGLGTILPGVSVTP